MKHAHTHTHTHTHTLYVAAEVIKCANDFVSSEKLSKR